MKYSVPKTKIWKELCNQRKNKASSYDDFAQQRHWSHTTFIPFPLTPEWFIGCSHVPSRSDCRLPWLQWFPGLGTTCNSPVTPQQGASTGVLLVVSSAITSPWSSTKPWSSLALAEAFLLSASTITVWSQQREMLSQHCPRFLCYYSNFHDITLYLNQSLLRSPLLEILALVLWQRWPNVPLSLSKPCTGFFLTRIPWPPFSLSIYFRSTAIVNAFCSTVNRM